MNPQANKPEVAVVINEIQPFCVLIMSRNAKSTREKCRLEEFMSFSALT